MATYQPPKRATAWIGYIGLPSQATPEIFQSTPTLAAGDFKVSIDGGALANLTTLPTNTPASSKMVKVSLSSSEMTGDNITVVCSDAAGAEWCDVIFNLQTSARQVDDLAYPATSGRSMVVDAAGLVDSNTVKQGPTGSGTAQTARDMGASVLLSSGTGTGQLDFTSGVVKANLAQILGTALTETAGLLAGGFKKFFNVASPTMDATSINQTGDNYARLGAPAGASVSADVAAINAKTTNLPPDPADESAILAAIGAVSAPTANQNADALLDRTDGVETGLTVRQALRLDTAVLVGKASGLTSTTAVYRDTNDTVDRVVATVDADGNRSTIVRDAS